MKPRTRRSALFGELVSLMTRLRAPGGCPWDRKQTHASLLRYLQEESREVRRAVSRRDWENLSEELGDVLLQVLFHSEIARQAGRFDIDDVLRTLKEKLVRRHPHVFGDKKGTVLTAAQVTRNWAKIKAAEKSGRRRITSRR